MQIAVQPTCHVHTCTCTFIYPRGKIFPLGENLTRSTQVEISSPGSTRLRFALLLFLSMKSGSTKIPLQETEQAATSMRNVHLWPQMLHLPSNDALISFLERNFDTGRVSWRGILRNGTAHHCTSVPAFVAPYVSGSRCIGTGSDGTHSLVSFVPYHLMRARLSLQRGGGQHCAPIFAQVIFVCN
jgi:hypothetical protein